MFSIDFEPTPAPQSVIGSKMARGVIRIGGFKEGFESALSYWTRPKYERHWHLALERILRESNSSALITSVTDPKTTNFITWWPMWRVGDLIFIQNQILFLDRLESRFDADHPYIHVPKRDPRAKKHDKVSEWKASIGDFQRFLSGRG